MKNEATALNLTPALLADARLAWNAALNATGGEFGFTSEIETEGKQTKAARRGRGLALANRLQAAGVLMVDENIEVNGKRIGDDQFYFTEAGTDLMLAEDAKNSGIWVELPAEVEAAPSELAEILKDLEAVRRRMFDSAEGAALVEARRAVADAMTIVEDKLA